MQHTLLRRHSIAVLLVGVGVLYSIVLFTPFASAATCTNTIQSGAAVPTGYGAAWNPLTSSQELIVQSTACPDNNNATIKVGNGQSNQYAYKGGYYWDGTRWQSYTLAGTNLVNNTWYVGDGATNIPVSVGATRYFVGYTCTWNGTAWKCGCRDGACTTAYWQIQGVAVAASGGGGGGGGSGGGSGPQCADATPPPGAQEAGLTKLAFCDDFSSASTIDLEGTQKDGFKWYITGLPFGYQGSSKNAYKVSDGVLEFDADVNQAQLSFLSAIVPKGSSQPVGWYINRETGGWYAETRISHVEKSLSKGFPAFWTMDMCHLYRYPQDCSRYIEPDWYEHINGGDVRASHNWSTIGGNHKLDSWNNYHPSGSNGTDWTAFNTVGVRALPGSYSHYLNDTQVTNGTASTKTNNGTYTWVNDVVAGPTELGTNVGRYPIILGTGPEMPFKLDWVRVWVKL